MYATQAPTPNPAQSYVQHAQSSHQPTSLYGHYQTQAQYSAQPDTYRGQQMPSYVIDANNGQGMQTSQFSGNSMPYDVNYQSSASGEMMNVAMRDYDLTWIGRFQQPPSSDHYRQR